MTTETVTDERPVVAWRALLDELVGSSSDALDWLLWIRDNGVLKDAMMETGQAIENTAKFYRTISNLQDVLRPLQCEGVRINLSPDAGRPPCIFNIVDAKGELKEIPQ